MVDKIKKNNILSFLHKLPGWEFNEIDEHLKKRISFKDFQEAFAFMTKVALYAEKHDHHPSLSNTYNIVEIILKTHLVGGITLKDIEMAEFIEEHL